MLSTAPSCPPASCWFEQYTECYFSGSFHAGAEIGTGSANAMRVRYSTSVCPHPCTFRNMEGIESHCLKGVLYIFLNFLQILFLRFPTYSWRNLTMHEIRKKISQQPINIPLGFPPLRYSFYINSPTWCCLSLITLGWFTDGINGAYWELTWQWPDFQLHDGLFEVTVNHNLQYLWELI